MINWCDVKDLGKVPDTEISLRLNVSPTAVMYARRRLGIPALNPVKKLPNINWNEVPLGKMIDQHIADLLDCSATYVLKQRRKRNIPAFGMLYRTLENQSAYYEESIIDLWLHNHNINHFFQHRIGSYRVDWYIPDKNEVWEFTGMWDHKIYGEQYRNNFCTKKTFLESMGYKVIQIQRNEIQYYKKDVDLSSIHMASSFRCRGCKRINQKHHARGLCGMCISRLYHQRELGPPSISSVLKKDEIFTCEDCGSHEKNRRVKQKCKYCYAKLRRIRRPKKLRDYTEGVDLYVKGYTLTEISTMIKCSKKYLSREIKKRGLKLRYGPKPQSKN